MAKRKKIIHHTKAKEPRVNHQITAAKVRLVSEGKGVEIVEISQALKMAEELEMDLVEISPDQDPPVCKLINFGKWKFEQQKKKKEQAKNQHVIHIKEIKLRPKIGSHDYDIKKDHAKEFLSKGDKVKVSLRFRGREMAHPGLGFKLMEKMTVDLADIGVVEFPPKMEGRQIVMVLSTKPGQKKKVDAVVKKKEVVSVTKNENSDPELVSSGNLETEDPAKD